MATIKKPKLPRKIKKAAFSDRWNYGLTKYRKTTLEITYKDGIPVDSVVVFKDKEE